MSTKTLLVLVVVTLQVAGLALLYKGCREEDSGMLGNLMETRRNVSRTEPADLKAKEPPKSLLQKYVIDPQNGVTALGRSPEFSSLDEAAKRVKLVEFFSLHVADVDFSLLPQEEQKSILREFLRRYAPEQ